MNYSMKSMITAHIDPAWEQENVAGSVLRVCLSVYLPDSSEPCEIDLKLKRWVERAPCPFTFRKGSYTIYDKAAEAYTLVRDSLLEFTTVAILRRERLMSLVLTRLLPSLWKEYQSRGEDVPYGAYRDVGKFFVELDLRRKPLDRLALVQRYTA